MGAVALCAFAGLVGFFVWTTDGLLAFGAGATGSRLARMTSSPQHDVGERRFVNPVPTETLEPGSVFQLLERWLFGGEQRIPEAAPRSSRGGEATLISSHAPVSG